MVMIVKRALAFIVLVLFVVAPLACVNINRPPENREVNVGGQHGVSVQQNSASNDSNDSN